MFSSFMALITIPNTLLLALIGLGAWVLFSASRSNRFQAVDMLLDEQGHASSSRLAVFVALSISTFMLAYVTINKTVGDETLLYMYGAYILTWAGSKTLDKGLEVWMNRPPANRMPMRGRSPYQEYDYYYDDDPGVNYQSFPRRSMAPRSLYDADLGPREQINPIAQFTPMNTPAKLDLAEKE